MVELQSCASLVNASSLCAIEKDMKGEGIGAVAEISAELQREKLRNAELVERVSMLEAQIQERDKDPLPADGEGSCEKTEAERRLKKFKRQKIEAVICGREDGNNIKREMEPQVTHDTQCMVPKNKRVEDGFVNWMSMDDNQFLNIEKTEDGDFTVECDDTDDSDDEDHYLYGEDDVNIDHKDRKIDDNQGTADKVQEQVHEECVDDGLQIPLESSSGVMSKVTLLYQSQERNDNQNNDGMLSYSQPICDKRESRKYVKEAKKTGESEATTGSRSIPQNKKPPKVAFCPKEIKRIMESEELLLKNAQSHTIRKIIVFASLGIRDGCEDMYDLDFNHFSILRKEEPYVSPQNPGEHVLYENPGGRRKIFYPNRQNPTLCPVKILEEEKDMRPFDASCPSCLFLCIKYGGRTRNLPQNEYVRQRMGRNKLKSFGPVMCRMAMLANIRNGSFFFKSLGITLLFMAGFPDDLVQRETKYRNLDLLQKYYRTDKDTEGEELFLPHPLNHHETASPGPQQLGTKTTSTKPKGKKQTNSTSKLQNLTKPSIQQPAPSRSALLSPLGLMSYNSIHSHAMAAFQSLPSQTPANNPVIPNTLIASSDTNVSFRHQTPYHLYPPQPTNAFMPMMFWPPPNTFPPSPYSSSYGYRSLPYTGNYLTLHPQPYYNHFSSTSVAPNMEEGTGKNNVAAEESDSDSNSSSNNSEQRLTQTSCKH